MTLWAHYYRETEEHYRERGERPNVKKPWDTFTEDVKKAGEQILIAHQSEDKLTKYTKEKNSERMGLIEKQER